MYNPTNEQVWVQSKIGKGLGLLYVIYYKWKTH